MFKPIRIISKPKAYGLVAHWGVQFPSGQVIDFTPEHGLRSTTLQEFAQGMPTSVVRELPWYLEGIVRERLEELRRNPRKYDLLQWNCETFANWLVVGIPTSTQVVGAMLLIAIATVLIASR